MMRLTPFFGMVFLPAVSAKLASDFTRLQSSFRRMNRHAKSLLIGGYVALLINLVFIGAAGKLSNYKEVGLGITASSDDSARFFKEQNLKGPIFNDFDVGGYLILKLFPEEKVFTDLRVEGYSPQFFSDQYLPMLHSEDHWKQALDSYGFNTIFLYRYDENSDFLPFVRNRLHDPEWALVYVDRYALIFVRNREANRPVIEKYQITTANIGEKLQHLIMSLAYDDQVAAGDTFNLFDRVDLADETFLKVVERWPNKGRIWFVLGVDALAKKDPELSIEYIQKAIAAGQKTSAAYYYLGVGYAADGNYTMAREAFGKALRINPDRQDNTGLMQKVGLQ
jgi:Tetratricopeptide repeat